MTTAVSDYAQTLPLGQFTEKAYLNYSMYVILDRALPYIGDGLKPVQRRIIYAMSELGLTTLAKYSKSAKTVGQVIGNYHPHGDSACYEAMVMMAQAFSYRYPLIDGQGNWGSADDAKSFAAMRYTESKLTAYAQVLLQELEQGTVDWQANFDASKQEPRLLPARLPNVLLNGTTGIAVGMATDIPPHNIREVVSACIHLLDHPQATTAELMQHIQGPDLPTGGEIITPTDELKQLYTSGRGSLKVRARYQLDEQCIIITELPYQVSGSKILEQIAQQMQTKKVPMIADLRDESDHEHPTRLVIELRSGRVDVHRLMGHLFATTDLQRTLRVNINVIGLDGRPQVKALPNLLQEWLSFRLTTVRRRTTYRLEKVNERLHILEGRLIAFLNIDEVIQIIRSEDHPKAVLMSRFALSAVQAEDILDIKLRQLAKLEEIKIRGQQQALGEERDQLNKLLASPRRLNSLIKKELLADAQQYGDDRHTGLVARQEAQAFSDAELLGSEPLTVILSQKGWIRAAKGHDIDPSSLSYKVGDGYAHALHCKSHQTLLLLDSSGRSYSLPSHDLPSARGQGEPLSGRLTLPANSTICALTLHQPQHRLLLSSSAGYGFIASTEDLHSKNKAGKSVLTLSAGAQVMPWQPLQCVDTDQIALVSNEGRLLIFAACELPQLAKGRGNKMINIPAHRASSAQEYVVCVCVLPAAHALTLYCGKRHLTLHAADLDHYRGERGRRGNKLPRGFHKVDRLQVVS